MLVLYGLTQDVRLLADDLRSSHRAWYRRRRPVIKISGRVIGRKRCSKSLARLRCPRRCEGGSLASSRASPSRPGIVRRPPHQATPSTFCCPPSSLSSRGSALASRQKNIDRRDYPFDRGDDVQSLTTHYQPRNLHPSPRRQLTWARTPYAAWSRPSAISVISTKSKQTSNLPGIWLSTKSPRLRRICRAWATSTVSSVQNTSRTRTTSTSTAEARLTSDGMPNGRV